MVKSRGKLISACLTLWMVFQASGMDMDIRMDSVAPRSRAPIPVTVTLKGDRPLTEGRLSIKLLEGKRALIDFQTEPLVVTNGTWQRRYLLPAISGVGVNGGQAEFQLLFETEKERFEKVGMYVSMPDYGSRIAVVAVVSPDTQRGPQMLRDLVNESRLETVMGLDQQPASGRAVAFNRILTWPASMRPEQLPGEPLWLTAYDMVAFSPDSLAELSERQVAALATWVRAGGSILLLRHGDISVPSTAPIHTMLEAVAKKGRAVSVLPTETQEALGVQLSAWQWDLGRVVLLDGLQADTEVEDPPWRKVFAFLWNVGAVPELAPTGTDDLRPKSSMPGHSMLDIVMNRLREFLGQALMPSNVTVLPMSTMVGLMAIFLIVSGPLEYCLLKRLRRRWLTWYTFPLTLLAMTAASFALGNRLMGAESSRQITLAELAADGQEVVRAQTVSLTFGGDSEQVISPQQGCLVMPLTGPEGLPAPPVPHVGRYPAEYETKRWAKRWTPYMQHVTELGSAVEVPPALQGVHWDAVRPTNTLSPTAARQALFDHGMRGKGIEGAVFVARDDVLEVSGSEGMLGLFSRFVASPENLDGGVWQAISYASYARDEGGPWVSLPRICSPHGDGLLWDWIVPEHDQWFISFIQGKDRVIFRYIYPEHG